MSEVVGLMRRPTSTTASTLTAVVDHILPLAGRFAGDLLVSSARLAYHARMSRRHGALETGHRADDVANGQRRSRAGAGGKAAIPEIVRLQRLAGNQAVSGLVGRRQVQRDPTYTGLDVTGVGADLSATGAFQGASAREHAAAAKRLKKAKLPREEIDVRIEMLMPKIDEAWERMKMEQRRASLRALATGSTAHVLGLFTAPEWFFKRPGTPFTTADKDKLVVAFTAKSRSRPDMAIVPGTIVWSEGDGPTDVVRNTAMVFHNGALVRTINKLRNLGDTTGYSRDVADRWHQPATRPLDGSGSSSVVGESSIFTLANLTTSLEVCGDHDGNFRAKRDAALTGTGASGVDLQIVVSMGATRNQTGDITRPGGHFVTNDASGGGARRTLSTNTASTAGMATHLVGSSTVPTAKLMSDFRATVAITPRTIGQRRDQAAAIIRPIKAKLAPLRNQWDGIAVAYGNHLAATPADKADRRAELQAVLDAHRDEDPRIDPIVVGAGQLWSAPGGLPGDQEDQIAGSAVTVLSQLVDLIQAVPPLLRGELMVEEWARRSKSALEELRGAGL